MPEECFLRYLLKFDPKESKTLSSIYTGILNNLSFEADYALWDGISLLCCNLKSLFCCGVSPRYTAIPQKKSCSHQFIMQSPSTTPSLFQFILSLVSDVDAEGQKTVFLYHI